MIRHIVIFTLDGFNSREEGEKQLLVIKKALEALPPMIPVLEAMQVSINTNPNEELGFMLDASLPSWESIELYAQHPAHVAVVKEHIAPYKKSRSCVDFEC